MSFHTPIALRLEAFQTAVTVADPSQPDCPLIFVNEAFEFLTGYRRRDIIGQNCRFLQGPETDELSVRRLRNLQNAGNYKSACVLNYRSDGTKFNNLLFVDVMRLPDKSELLIGCQFEFQLDQDPSDIVDERSAAVGPVVGHLGRQIGFRKQFQLRSSAVMASINDYIVRLRLARNKEALEKIRRDMPSSVYHP